MARAAAQMMGIFAAVEGVKFGRRIPALLQAILPALQRATQEVWLLACLLTQMWFLLTICRSDNGLWVFILTCYDDHSTVWLPSLPCSHPHCLASFSFWGKRRYVCWERVR